MKKSCHYCGRIHDTAHVCPAKPARKSLDTKAKKIRNKNQWKIIKRQANERDRYLCRACLADGRLYFNEVETHHIVSIDEDASRAYELGNLITLCRGCHEEAESGKIAKDILFALAATEARIR